ncbi:MAG TPA: ribokinase [Casimicrobiaceae bacterium]|nr:ribokinase [Casimicrobiaceae bacterium]
MVVVFGSINVDFITRVARFPRPGETIVAESFAMHAGGKGANQALAAARAGAAVALYGAVGRDPFADAALALLAAAGVGLDGVAKLSDATGSATILVDALAENCIAIAAGANERADPEAVPDAVLGPATTLVLQHEVPADANAAIAERARDRGARIVLNAAPARPVPADLLRRIDLLVVNETEAAALAPARGWPGEPAAFARAAAAVFPRLTAVVTRGRAGAIACSGAECLSAMPPLVDVVDTTGAGDAFVGVLAAKLDAGSDLREALAHAVAAGTLACASRGAQPSLPDRAAIDTLLPLVTTAAA